MQTNQISFDEFSKIEMRLGKIINVLDFPRAKNPSYKVQISFGAYGEKWSSAQLTNYPKEELLDGYVVCVCNLPPRNIAGFMSEVLVLGVPNNKKETIILQPQSKAELGAIVY